MGNNPADDHHSADFVDLTGVSPFAQGANRFCFQHPLNPDNCLKVIRPENIEARFNRQSRLKNLLGKKRLNDNLQELKAHHQPAIRSLQKAGREELIWGHLPRFYGSVNTSLGQANESEIIRCKDGAVAPTLETMIKHYGGSSSLNAAINEFLEWLRVNLILTRNLLPHNLVVSDRSGRSQLFLVDGLGAPTIPQALAPMPGWSSHYIERKIDRFRKRLAWEQHNEGLSWEDFQRLR
ncbi:MAG: YrbL family protein [Marinobacter sp.]